MYFHAQQEDGHIKIKNKGIYKVVNTVQEKLRSTVKDIGMGNYINDLLNASPLLHPMNRVGNRIAFTNCHIFDGMHSDIKEDMTLLVEGDKIFNVGHRKQLTVPENFYNIDMAGQTIMPGLIDNHVHLCSPFTYEVTVSAIRQMPMQVALNNMRTVYSGVTTVCDMGGPQCFIKEFSELADKNQIPGPRYLNCYTLISPSKGKKLGYPSQVKVLNPFNAWLLEGQVATRPKTINTLRKACYKVKDNGGTHLKTTYQPQPFSAKQYMTQDDFPIFSDEWMRIILEIGKETGLFVDIHSPYGMATERCVDLAIAVGAKIRIQHMTFDIDLKDSLVKKMQDNGFYIIPTVTVFGDAFQMPKFVQWLDDDPKSHMMPEANRQAKDMIQKGIDMEPFSGQMVMECDNVYFREHFNFVKRNTQKAHEAGIIGIGTDCGGTNTGFFGRIYSEVMHYLEFGIPFLDILKYLTSVNAEIDGLNDRGVIQPGKLADLIALDCDGPLNSSALTEVSMVMKGGMFLKHRGVELAAF